MSNLSTSDVSYAEYPSGTPIISAFGDTVGHKKGTAKKVKADVADAGDGTATHKIPAAAFGFTKLIDASNFTINDDSIIVMSALNWDCDEILLKAAGSNAPDNYYDRFQFWVAGI